MISRNNALRAIMSAVLALFCCLAAAASAPALEFRSEPLTIRLAGGKVLNFTVELATTAEQRELGLMNRDSMADDHGMLFDFGETRPVYMWMRNTYLPLDMLYLSESGVITHIHPDALPLSENIIDSKGAVRFVIEINGGLAAKLGIRPGDVATSEKIAKAAAKESGRAISYCSTSLKRVIRQRFKTVRSVAQPGSASGLGPEGREFESLHSDHLKSPH